MGIGFFAEVAANLEQSSISEHGPQFVLGAVVILLVKYITHRSEKSMDRIRAAIEQQADQMRNHSLLILDVEQRLIEHDLTTEGISRSKHDDLSAHEKRMAKKYDEVLEAIEGTRIAISHRNASALRKFKEIRT